MSIDTFLNVYRAYLVPVISILGITGNILVILVFSKKRISRFNIYSIALLIAHSLALFINSFLDDFLGRGLYYATSRRVFIKIDIQSQFACVIMEYTASVMYFSSGFLTVIFTIDRFLVLTWPFKFKGDDKVNKSIVICLVIFGLGYLSSIPLALSYKLIKKFDKFTINNKSCKIDTSDSNLASVSLYYESLVVFVIPTLIVLVINACIIYKVFQISKTRSAIVVDKRMSRLEMSRVIGMLAVTSSFLLFTIPLSVTIIVRLQTSKSKSENIEALAKFFDSLKDISYSLNFIIYYTFLSYFKHDLKAMFTSSPMYQFLSSVKSPEPDTAVQEFQLT